MAEPSRDTPYLICQNLRHWVGCEKGIVLLHVVARRRVLGVIVTATVIVIVIVSLDSLSSSAIHSVHRRTSGS
jgi:hypothetical protein